MKKYSRRYIFFSNVEDLDRMFISFYFIVFIITMILLPYLNIIHSKNEIFFFILLLFVIMAYSFWRLLPAINSILNKEYNKFLVFSKVMLIEYSLKCLDNMISIDARMRSSILSQIYAIIESTKLDIDLDKKKHLDENLENLKKQYIDEEKYELITPMLDFYSNISKNKEKLIEEVKNRNLLADELMKDEEKIKEKYLFFENEYNQTKLQIDWISKKLEKLIG